MEGKPVYALTLIGKKREKVKIRPVNPEEEKVDYYVFIEGPSIYPEKQLGVHLVTLERGEPLVEVHSMKGVSPHRSIKSFFRKPLGGKIRVYQTPEGGYHAVIEGVKDEIIKELVGIIKEKGG